MRILLTGRTGQVGSALERSLAPLGELAAFDRTGLDLQSIGNAVSKAKPDIIVNAAAYTAVDRAEQERDLAFAVNASAAGDLAGQAKAIGALLVHFSTDYVFDGEKPAPYVETDAPNPLSVYGLSKLEGERAIAASGCRHVIFRTSWVYAAAGRNFMHTILAAAKTRPELRVVADQHGAPTSSEAIALAVARVLDQPDKLKSAAGLYHLSAGGGDHLAWLRYCDHRGERHQDPGARDPQRRVSGGQQGGPKIRCWTTAGCARISALRCPIGEKGLLRCCVPQARIFPLKPPRCREFRVHLVKSTSGMG